MAVLPDASEDRVVVFYVDEQRYALPLPVVDSVVRMVEIIHVPGLPEYIQGVINVHGTIMAVINLRRRMNLEDRTEVLEDRLIITHCKDRCYALMVDSVSEVMNLKGQSITDAGTILPNQEFLTGIAKMQDGMILLSDPHALLAFGDQDQINAILEQVKL